ncbi:hypothetical protein [Microbacterium sp.]|uniref:hypothetical protein n=1 Tax=Microbacterium sp. TaxID=51671 RepID=UPI002FE06F57
MSTKKRGSALLGMGTLLLAALFAVGSGQVAFAGADSGTTGKGKIVTPTSSPYISYAYVTECRGFGGGAYIWQSKATLGTDVAYGPTYTVTDGDSQVTLRKNGSYGGSWRCINKAPGV